MPFKRKNKIILIVAVLIVAGLALFLRGPYVSNFLKAMVLPEVQSALGRQVTARKIGINIFPLYAEAREIKVFNEKGERLLAAESIKAYIGLSQIFNKQVALNSIVIKKPQVWIDNAQAVEIAGFLNAAGKKPGGSGKKPLSLNVKTVVIRDGEISYFDESLGGLVHVAGLNTEVVLRERPEIDFSVDEVKAALGKLPELKGSASGNIFVDKDSIEVKRINAEVEGSRLTGTGRYSFDKTSLWKMDLDLDLETAKKIAGLNEPGYGSIRARGTLRVDRDLTNPSLDFDVKGDFYLQTLMELVKARTSHKLTGLVSFDGNVNGNIKNLKGSAEARLRNGNLYTIDVEDAKCKATYENLLLKFSDGKGKVYDGQAGFDVTLVLPSVHEYTVDVDFKDVDSPPVFERIGMTWLDLPFGSVKGKFFTSGRGFKPNGWAEYKVIEPREDPIGRFRKISTKYSMVKNVVTLSELKAETGTSHMALEGKVDLNNSTLDMKSVVSGGDIKEFTTPYYDGLSGGISFTGTASGTFSDPLIEGNILMADVFLGDYPIGEVNGHASYRKNLFVVRDAVGVDGGSTYRVDGTVAFPWAKKFLELKQPKYDLDVELNNADVEGIMKLHKLDVPSYGVADGKVRIEGSGTPLYSGEAQIRDGSIYGFDVSTAAFDFSYDFDVFRLKNAVMKKGESELSVDGSVTNGGAFDFSATTEKFYPDTVLKRSLPLTYRMAFEAEGRGTFEQPEITLNAVLSEGNFLGREVGGGKLDASLKGKELNYNARVFKDKMALRGGVLLDGEMPWNAEMEITKGRYDFLATAFFKDVPEDMMLNVTGRAMLSGTKDRLDAEASLSQITMAMFGQSFSNDDDISFTIDDGKVMFPKFKLRSGTTEVNLQGSFKYGDFYDVIVYGTSSLAPLKAFSEKISLLRGTARFVIALQGDWENPNINGGMDVTDGAFGIKDIPQRLASINGYSYFEDDTVVIEKVNAKLGGGDIELSGAMKLEGLKPETVNLDMLLKNVNLMLTKGFKANLGGNLIYRGRPDSKIITGEVSINRAEYTDRIEWRSWLLKVRRTEASGAGKGLLDDIELSVRLYGDNNVSIDNNVARANLTIDTILRGTIGEPLLLGRVEASEGKVYFRNSEFNIVHATADFSDTSHTDPYVDIVAETTVKGYHIWLTLEGRLQQLDLTLVSDPELEDEEIIALLTVGEFGEKLSGLEGGIGAAEASSVLTGQFQNVVEERLRDLTGISRFSIDPYVSRRTGTITPRLTVSKRLGSDLFVTYSSSMSTSEEQEIKLEYVVNRNVSLLGGQDDLGTIGGDVRFRFFFK